ATANHRDQSRRVRGTTKARTHADTTGNSTREVRDVPPRLTGALSGRRVERVPRTLIVADLAVNTVVHTLHDVLHGQERLHTKLTGLLSGNSDPRTGTAGVRHLGHERRTGDLLSQLVA